MGMIERKCKVCERNKFKVKRESKQEVCSMICRMKLMTQEERLILERKLFGGFCEWAS